MANYVDCTKKLSALPLETLLRALFAEETTSAGQYAFRIVSVTAGDGDVIACKDKDTFEELFNQAIVIADDNKPALRVCITDRANGANLQDVPDCVNAENLGLMARLSFIHDTNGDVAVNLANIT